jgi:hypothetical protein
MLSIIIVASVSVVIQRSACCFPMLLLMLMLVDGAKRSIRPEVFQAEEMGKKLVVSCCFS